MIGSGKSFFLNLTFLSLLAAGSCTLEDIKRSNFAQQDKPETNLFGCPKPPNPEQAESSDNSVIDPKTIPIKCVTANVDREVQITPVDVMDNINVPMIRFKPEWADHVQVLRCAMSYDLRDPQGNLYSPSAMAADSFLDQRKWFWTQAIAQANQCQMITESAIGLGLSDFAAPTGSYRYIINPCRTVGERTECSYLLEETTSFTYTSHFNEEILAAQNRATDAAGRINAKISYLRVLADRIMVQLRYCDELSAKQGALYNWRRGLLQVTVFFAAGGLGMMVGPTMAYMAAVMSVSMLEPIIATTFLGWPPLWENTCKDPTIPGPSSIRDNIQEMAQTRDQLIDAQKSLQAAIAAVAALDQKILTLDEAIARYREHDFDPDNPDDFTSFVSSGGGNPFAALLGGQ